MATLPAAKSPNREGALDKMAEGEAMGAIAGSDLQEKSAFSDQEIACVAEASPESIAEWVEDVSRARGLSFRERPSDIFASAAARLSDAEVEFDETEQLLLALERARVITSFQRGLLQACYLR